jgi:hypothetical protein
MMPKSSGGAVGGISVMVGSTDGTRVSVGNGVDVGAGVSVGSGVGDSVSVGVVDGVTLGFGVSVGGVGDGVGEFVGVGDKNGVFVGVSVENSVGVCVDVSVGVDEGNKATTVGLGVDDDARVGATVGVMGIPGCKLQANIAIVRLTIAIASAKRCLPILGLLLLLRYLPTPFFEVYQSA